MARDGYRSRLSDYLNAPERAFLALTDVELTPLDGSGAPDRYGFLVISVLLVEGFVHDVGWWAAAWIVGGYIFWTLTEYWLHRVVFHFEPEKGIGARLHWIIHGVHHDYPNDPLRLVMPPSVSVPLAALFFGLFVLVVGTPDAYPFTAGFLGGYLVYDMLHYHLHHHVPATRPGRWMRELHMRH